MRFSSSGALITSYNAEPPPANRTRRKCVRSSGGNDNSRRICSTNARSLSKRSADFCHDIELQSMTVTGDSIELRRWIKRTEYHRIEIGSERL